MIPDDKTSDINTSTGAIAGLLAGVTPGPWGTLPTRDSVYDSKFCEVACYMQAADRRFIAAARELVPALTIERDQWRQRAQDAELEIVGLRARVEYLKAQLYGAKPEGGAE